MKVTKFCLKIFCLTLSIILFILGCEKNNSIIDPKENREVVPVVPKDDIVVMPPDNIENGVNDGEALDESKMTKVAEKNGEYQIYDSKELFWIANEANKNRNNFRGKTVRLMNDIDMEDKPFEGIATGGKGNNPYYSFEGTFDGNDKKIKGLNIEDTSGYYIGFIGNLGKGTVKNLEIESGSINGIKFVGGIAGVSGGVIENCNNKSVIITGEERIGGIAGFNLGTITNSGNSANVTGSIVKSTFGFVGGIAGANRGITVSSYNTGSITGRNQVGGIIGANSSTVKNSYNTGAVEGNDMVGGVLGNNNMGIVKDSYNTGDIKSTYSFGIAGGVVGFNWNFQGSGTSIIENCYNTGQISSPYVYLGGVVGRNFNGEVKSSFFLQGKAKHGVGDPKTDDNAKSISASDFGGNSTILWGSSSPWKIKSGLGGSVSARPVLSGVGEEGK